MTDERIEFLLVEDNELDAEKIERCFKQLKILNPIVRAQDGVDALEKLRGENGNQKLAGNIVVLLDLNMPRMNGIEFLEELRADRQLATLPVFVLTTSDRNADIEDAFDHDVAGYAVKPIDRASMADVLGKLGEFGEIACLGDEPKADAQ